MPVTLGWEQIAIRILLAAVASFLIGYNRDERGKRLGIRTTMLVCLAATLAMLQANLLMNSTGKAPDSFVNFDLMRLPLGILSGIGFIGAGAILRKDGLVRGVTTAATIWFVTVLGLLFGGGQLSLGIAGTLLGPLHSVGSAVGRNAYADPSHRLSLHSIQGSPISLPIRLSEAELRQRFQAAGFVIKDWTVTLSRTLNCTRFDASSNGPSKATCNRRHLS